MTLIIEGSNRHFGDPCDTELDELQHMVEAILTLRIRSIISGMNEGIGI